ncbi:MAG: cytochrome c biogenesis protein CcsA [Cytophagales bacterium]|nr:cytochrome c biogenesis protein CcsA [Cytophagales bacterium]
MKKLLAIGLRLVDTRAAGAYILLFAISIGVATFIENDFGTSAAQKVVYQSWWFTLLLLLFGLSILVNIWKFRMIQQKKWALLMFHLAMIVILIGAGVTRYFGFEGIMHIRENESSNSFLSSETYLQFKVQKGDQLFKFDEQVSFASLGNNDFEEQYLLGTDLIEVKVTEFIPNPQQTLNADPEGKPTLKVVFGGGNGREEYFISQGEAKRIKNLIFNFRGDFRPGAINIRKAGDRLQIQSDEGLTQMVMATQQRDTLLADGTWKPLMLRSLYTANSGRFVFGDYHPQSKVSIVSTDQKVKRESHTALKLDVTVNGDQEELYVYGQKGMPGRVVQAQLSNLAIGVSYGSKPVELPFAIQLHDFQMERYPGTDNAASYASEVRLIDKNQGTEYDYRIYMNHILDYGGYRFFQSSFDRDELGTYLSVNHDWWGTWISYVGYFMLTLGMVLALFSEKSRFYQVQQSLKKMRTAGVVVILFVLLPNLGNAQKVIDQAANQIFISAEHAEKFSKIVVQDHRGRMKPMHTLSREIMRKVVRKESVLGLSADQVILGMFANRRDWLHVPLIKLGKHPKIHEQLGVAGPRARYSDFFTKEGAYKFRDEVREVYSLEPIDRGIYEKELLKIDERVNILNMVFSGRMFRLVPLAGDENNEWTSSMSSHQGHNHSSDADLTVAKRFFDTYRSELVKSLKSGNYAKPDQILRELNAYQEEVGSQVRPSAATINLEIMLNQMNVFNRLAGIYALLGVVFLFFLFFTVFKPQVNLKWAYRIVFGALLLSFVYHTAGLGLRWYVSGRAPWSNGYESMIYIAWTTMLAGILFTRKSWGGLAATSVLAATVLLVALLSHMDPEITPLVPVLKSYWLTIHVSLEAGSYGFLMLGAVIGIINLILFMFLTPSNKDRVNRKVKEMSYLSELTLIGGLIMISTGTYLGGIWANESWGRYWGWDAKETWALVTILVYVFILHMRIIPKLFGLFAYNFATIFGLASVIMTYYGVNYYLSGLHSYAAGDPVPIPDWVYIVVTAILSITIIAYIQHRRVNLSSTKPSDKKMVIKPKMDLKPQLNQQ